MSSDGCDSGGGHCGGHDMAAGGWGDAGYATGADGKTPIPNAKGLEINGAPVIEAKNEFVIKKRAPEAKL